MAWDDPSPRSHSRAAPSRPSAQPGYGEERISFARLVFRVVIAGIVGVLACFVAKAALTAWRGPSPHTSSLDMALTLAIGFAVAALALKFVMNRPVTRGLSARVRDGGGWGSGGYSGDAVDNLIATEAIVDLAEMAADVIADL